MAAVASPTFPQHFGPYPHPPPFSPGQDNYPRPPPVNRAPPGPYPRPATSGFDQAPSSPVIPPPPGPAYRPTPDRPDHTRHHRQRNKRVAFSTPSGGYYSTSSSPTIPTLPQKTRQDGSPRRSPWSRFLNRSQQDRTIAPAEASRPVIPTVLQSQPSSTTREQQREQVISLLLPHVPAAEPMIRPLVNHTNDSLLLQQLIDTLNRPLTQQQFLEIQDAFTLPRDEEEEIIKTLNDPRDPDVAILLTQFREFVEAISGRPIPTALEQVPAAKGGAFSRLGRLIPSAIRKSLRSLNRRKRQSAGAYASSSASAPELVRPSTEQQDGTKSFPIYKLRESQLRRFIVESFTCTKCETNIPVNRTRGTDPQLGANLHLRCPNPNCLALFCRGCHRHVMGCQLHCNARHACSLKSCCSEVRGMAIFEYLSIFDEDYLTRIRNFHHGAADAHTSANRLSFLEHAFDPANRRDPRFRGFISVVKRTLKYVCFWLEPSVPENVACDDVAYMVAASFLMEVIRAFLMRGIENLAHFRARGYLIHRITDLLLSWTRKRSGPFYDLIEGSPLVIDTSPGTRRLIWDPEFVWEGHFSTAETPTILENMRNLWTGIENEVGSETLRDAANEFDTRLYERGHELSLFRHS